MGGGGGGCIKTPLKRYGAACPGDGAGRGLEASRYDISGLTCAELGGGGGGTLQRGCSGEIPLLSCCGGFCNPFLLFPYNSTLTVFLLKGRIQAGR